MQISDKELQVINQLEFDGHYELAEFLRSRLEGLKEEVKRETRHRELLQTDLLKSDTERAALREEVERLKEEIDAYKARKSNSVFDCNPYE